MATRASLRLLSNLKKYGASDISACFNCGNCNDCDNCWLYCPEVAVTKDEKTGRSVNLDYCKGCGICVVECPRCAMALMEETG